MHDLIDAYNAAIMVATNKFHAAETAAWDDLQAAIRSAELAFEEGREARMAMFYAGPIVMPKADVPEGVVAALERAVDQSAKDAGLASQQIAAE